MDLIVELKEKFNLKDSDFYSHESDLYVRDKLGIRAFLKGKEIVFSNFKNNLDNSIWLDIPFMNSEYWKRKEKGK